MIRAAPHGSLSLLKQFVKWGADLNAPDMTNMWHPTVLYEASRAGHLEIIKFILEHGVDVNARAGSWGSALAAAAMYGQTAVVEYLLIHRADPNAHDNILNNAVHGGLETVKMLIDKGVNLQVQGETALENATINGKLDIVKLLIAKGVSPKKEHIFQVACFWGRLEVVQFLVENGADVNALHRDWGTALRAAVQGSQSKVIEFLIESGADVNATGGEPLTPLQLAIQKGYKEIVDILWRHGARR
ncbi:ankyrin repeat-containing domain protein [Mycena floridula]|nr:ankyrin repeat-containing domain protein [Mycena floridula]